jgi:hypothetical protein
MNSKLPEQMEAVDASTGFVWPVEAAVYHADCTRVSQSGLKILDESPRLFNALFVEKSLPPKAPTADMKFGTLLHLVVLEFGEFSKRYATPPTCAPDGTAWDRRKKDHKAAWQQEIEKANGRELLDNDVYRLLFDMAGAISDHPIANMLELGGPVEQAIVWQDEDTGIACKSLRDKVLRGGTLIADLKTCADPSPEGFARAALAFSYHRQNAFYVDGHAAVFGEDPQGMVFIAIGKEPPYSVGVYELDYDAIALGRKQNAASLRDLARRRETGDWTAEWEKRIYTLPLPKWAWSEDQWKVAE